MLLHCNYHLTGLPPFMRFLEKQNERNLGCYRLMGPGKKKEYTGAILSNVITPVFFFC